MSVIAGTACHRKPEFREPRILRVLELDLQHDLARQFADDNPSVHLNDQRQQIEASGVGRWRPAERADPLGEGHVHGVAQHRAVCVAVSGVADQLVVPDPNARMPFPPLGENRLRWNDATTVGGYAQVLDTGLENLVGIIQRAGVDDLQRAPMQTSYATH